MEIHNAKILRNESNTLLLLIVKSNTYEIVLTDDKPNEVKIVFNNLLAELKNGEFNFLLEQDLKEDLYYHISKEYITQLNSELTSIYKELTDYDLLTKK